MNGENHCFYVRRFHYAGFPSQDEARRASLGLWRKVERLGSAAEVERAAERWLERRGLRPRVIDS